MESAETPSVLVLCPDLFFASQIQGAIQRAGRVGRTCLSQAGLEKQAATLPPGGWIIVHLMAPGLDLPRLRAAAPQSRLLAFGPHVKETALRAAAEAGCDRVLTQGQAASQLDQILAEV